MLQLKSTYHDATTHIAMSLQEFTQRLAARVPHPRLHLIRFCAVLAPHAKPRSAVVPGKVEKAGEPADEHAQRSARACWAWLLKRVCVFDLDIAHCPN